MTETIETDIETEQSAQAPEAPETTTEHPEPETAPEDDNPGKEAAKYRRRLRETETERDTLRTQVEALQRAAVEQVAGKHLHKPAGLWASGVTPAELVDDNGNVDPEKVQAAARAAAESLGLARAAGGNHVPREGYTTSAKPRGSRFEDALRQQD